MSVVVNGSPGFAILTGGEYDFAISLTVENARITRVDMVRAPDKLTACRGNDTSRPR